MMVRMLEIIDAQSPSTVIWLFLSSMVSRCFMLESNQLR